MATVVQICNLALSRIGAGAINSLDDASKAARVCKLNFADTRDAVLRAHPWKCAKNRIALAPLSTTPVFDWAYEYQLPSDCLRPLRLAGDVDFTVEGRKLLCDSGAIKLLYIKRITDPNDFDALLVQALAHRLAFVISPELTADEKKTLAQWQAYGVTVAEARSISAQEGTDRSLPDGSWVDAR